MSRANAALREPADFGGKVAQVLALRGGKDECAAIYIEGRTEIRRSGARLARQGGIGRCASCEQQRRSPVL